jgi:hypothetical protein
MLSSYRLGDLIFLELSKDEKNEILIEHLDLCCAVKSKCFVQGTGYFSKLIIEIRKKLHLQNIETSVHD